MHREKNEVSHEHEVSTIQIVLNIIHPSETYIQERERERERERESAKARQEFSAS